MKSTIALPERPKYYFGRTIFIYILTLISGAFVNSIILASVFPLGTSSTFFEDFLGYFTFGLFLTSILCIPIIFILIFGFTYIYKNHINRESTWRKLIYLSSICVITPLICTAVYAFMDMMSPKDLLIWTGIMLVYVFFGMFYILYISNFYDRKNPPISVKNSIPLLEDVLDSGLDDGI